ALRLALVLAVGRRELRVAGDLRRGAELRERLLLDRVRIRQVLRELFRDLGHGRGLPARPRVTRGYFAATAACDVRSCANRSAISSAVRTASAPLSTRASACSGVSTVRR